MRHLLISACRLASRSVPGDTIFLAWHLCFSYLFHLLDFKHKIVPFKDQRLGVPRNNDHRIASFRDAGRNIHVSGQLAIVCSTICHNEGTLWEGPDSHGYAQLERPRERLLLHLWSKQNGHADCLCFIRFLQLYWLWLQGNWRSQLSISSRRRYRCGGCGTHTVMSQGRNRRIDQSSQLSQRWNPICQWIFPFAFARHSWNSVLCKSVYWQWERFL